MRLLILSNAMIVRRVIRENFPMGISLLYWKGAVYMSSTKGTLCMTGGKIMPLDGYDW